ncbi:MULTISPECIES: hypothetical protein [Bacillus]|nr:MULTISPECIES: hypothetical protein [Bacillus]MCB4339897.1 hypothetical protein [Bacillus subtilis]MEC1265014.1 hypothetical protein [Bacillus subtilis]MEC2235773.1 hypothetical protein [Bacillus subtilis]MED1678778.1 hypothetical protein [Bacillus subtilis]MED4865250.1 hypothetical protein [Bacillus subtilis]
MYGAGRAYGYALVSIITGPLKHLFLGVFFAENSSKARSQSDIISVI